MDEDKTVRPELLYGHLYKVLLTVLADDKLYQDTNFYLRDFNSITREVFLEWASTGHVLKLDIAFLVWFSKWVPALSRRECPLLQSRPDLQVGSHALMLPSGWRLSPYNREQFILRNLPVNQRLAYMVMKATKEIALLEKSDDDDDDEDSKTHDENEDNDVGMAKGEICESEEGGIKDEGKVTDDNDEDMDDDNEQDKVKTYDIKNSLLYEIENDVLTLEYIHKTVQDKTTQIKQGWQPPASSSAKYYKIQALGQNIQEPCLDKNSTQQAEWTTIYGRTQKPDWQMFSPVDPDKGLDSDDLLKDVQMWVHRISTRLITQCYDQPKFYFGFGFFDMEDDKSLKHFLKFIE